MKQSKQPEEEELVERLGSEPPKDVHKPPLGRSLRKRIFLRSIAVLGVISSLILILPASLVGICFALYRAFRLMLKPLIKMTLTPEEALKRMTLKEKVKLTAGETTFTMAGCRRLGIPPVKFTDGPSGARGLATTPTSLLEWGVVADLPLIGNKINFQDPNTNKRSFMLQKMQKLIPDVLQIGPGTFAVCAPCGTALAASWDKLLVYQIAALIGRDTRSKGAHVILGPTLNLTRTPTGGRNFEAFGEDPFLAGVFGVEWVNGAQSVPGVAACAKHFVANELEHKRFVTDSVVDERPLRELYLRHFQIVVENTDLACIMTGYNRVNGEYACLHHRLINDVLREEWGFEGVVMSDWGGAHGTVDSIKHGTLLDLEMPGPPRVRGKKLLEAVREGLVEEGAVSAHALRLLKLTDRTRGPYGPGYSTGHEEERPAENTVDDRHLLRRAIRESVVLLKNKDDVLPLNKGTNVRLYGPNAAKLAITGGGSVETLCPTPQTLSEAFGEVLDQTKVEVVSGKYAGMETADDSRFDTFTIDIFENVASIGMKEPLATITAEKGKYLLPTVNLATWSLFAKCVFKGAKWDKAGVRVSTTLKAKPEAAAGTKSLHAFALSASGPTRLSVDGAVIANTPDNFESDPNVWGYTCLGFGSKEVFGQIELDDSIDHVVNLEWSAHKGFIADEYYREGYLGLFQGFNACPFAYHLKHKCESTSREVLNHAAELAANTAVNIVCVGRQPSDETEFKDAISMDIADGQLKLIRAVSEAAQQNNNKTIVLLNAGSPMTTSSWIGSVDAAMLVHFVGQEGAGAIADLIFGEYTPSGKLTYTIPKTFEDNPTYTAEGARFPGINGVVRFDEGMDIGYRYYDKHPGKVAFPFGFGLSYGTVSVGQCSLSGESSMSIAMAQDISSPTKFKVSVEVSNESDMPGSEVIQLYCSLPESAVERPPKQLIGFQKIHLAAGQKDTVEVEFSSRYSFEYYDEEENSWRVEPGNYSIHVATSSTSMHQTLPFEVSRTTAIGAVPRDVQEA